LFKFASTGFGEPGGNDPPDWRQHREYTLSDVATIIDVPEYKKPGLGWPLTLVSGLECFIEFKVSELSLWDQDAGNH
jgi:hypothetical protein